MSNFKFDILKNRDRMDYHDVLSKDAKFKFTPSCPLCKARLYSPGFMHTWMIVKRSDILDVKENINHPVLMHKDCAIRYEVTKRLLISAGEIKPDPVEVASIWDSMNDVFMDGAKNIRDYQSQFLGSFQTTAHGDQLDALALSFGTMRIASNEDDAGLRSRLLQLIQTIKVGNSIINEDIKS